MDQLQLFATLAMTHPSFAEYLRAELQSTDKVLRNTLAAEMLHRAQGKAQFIENLLELLEKAPRVSR